MVDLHHPDAPSPSTSNQEIGLADTAVDTPAALLRLLATIVIALAIPILLVSSAVRSVTLNESFYMREFERYGVGQVTGFSEAELSQVARIFISYFQGDPGRLDARVVRGTGTIAVFNEREIAHMVDVQVLIQRVFQAGWVALALMIVATLAIVVPDPTTSLSALLRAAAIGGAVTASVVGLAAAGSLIDFNRLFLMFHFLSFSNDLWLLDPNRDRLIQLFPEGFFYDAALQIGARSAGIGALMAVTGFFGLRVVR